MSWDEVKEAADRRLAVTFGPLGKGGSNHVIVTFPPELCRELELERNGGCRVYIGTIQDAGSCRIDPVSHGPHKLVSTGRGALRVAFRPVGVEGMAGRPREECCYRLSGERGIVVDMPEWFRTAFARSRKPAID